jgi:hypothetical protein
MDIVVVLEADGSRRAVNVRDERPMPFQEPADLLK